MNEKEKFRAKLAAMVLPFFTQERWGNLAGPSDASYYAKEAVEFADAIITEVLKNKNERKESYE